MNYHDNDQEDKFWTTLLGTGHCACYDGAVDLDVLNVAALIGTERPIFYTVIAQQLGLQERYVQMIQYLLCGADLAEYGTSPRGCWLTKEGVAWLEQFRSYHEYLKKE